MKGSGYKGFEKDWTCRGFQFEVGKTYTEKRAVLCESGFHYCEYPMDVFAYYPPTGKLAEVEADDVQDRADSDSKRCAKSITIKAEIGIPALVQAAFEYTLKRCEPAKAAHSDGDSSASSATGYSSASSATGYRSASSATGDRSASSATGYRSVVRGRG
jgi:hypothetical protein